MATTKGPLFSANASGTLRDAIVYSKNKGRSYVRAWTKPSQPNVESQLFERAAVSAFSNWWRYIQTVPDLVTKWHAYGQSLNLPGFQAFQHFNLKRRANDVDPTGTPSDGGSARTGTVSGITNEVVNANRVTLTINWNSNGDPWNLLVLALSTNGGGSATAQHINRIIAHKTAIPAQPTLTITIPYLPTGTWRVRSNVYSTNGSQQTWAFTSGVIVIQ